MADTNEIVVRISSDGADKTSRGLDQLASSGDKAERSLGSLEKTAELAKRGLEAFGLALGLVEMVRLANEAREAAERFGALGAIAQQMGATMSISTERIIATQNAMRGAGATMEDARGAVVKLMNAHIDLANATSLYAIAQNLSVKESISEREAMDELVLAVQTGMARTLRHAGVVADFTKATKDAANAMGVQTDQLSDQAIEQIRLNEVVKAAAAIQGSYAAVMQTGQGRVIEANKALKDLAASAGLVLGVLAEGPITATADAFKRLAAAIRDNPKILVDIADAVKSITEAVGIGLAVWATWQALVIAVGAKLAIVGGIETITAILSLTKAVTSAADAFVLLGFAAEAINPAAIVTSLAAIAAGLFVWKKITADTKDETKEFSEQLNGLGKQIVTTGGVIPPLSAGLSSSAEALKKLITLRAEVPTFVAGLTAIGDAYLSSGKGAAELATQSAKLREAIAAESIGLVGKDKIEMAALLTRKASAQSYVDEAKAVRDVIDAGGDAVRAAAQQAIASHLVGRAARDAAIEFEHQNAVLKDQRDLIPAVAAVAIQAADATRDAQLRAAHEIAAAQPFQNMLANAGNEFSQFFGGLVTNGVNSFKGLADQIRNIFASLVSDLARMFFEKRILPQLASMIGLGTLTAKDASTIAGIASVATHGHGSLDDSGGIPTLPAVTSTAGAPTLGTYATAAGIGIAGLATSYGIGGAAGSTAGAALGGAASGALAGAAIGAMAGPLGAAVGGIVGAVGGMVTGLLGHAAAMKKARAEFEDGQQKFIDGLQTFPSSAAQTFAGIEKAFKDLQDAAQAAHTSVSADAVAAKNIAEAKVKTDFLTSLGQQFVALEGPAGAFTNALDAINQQAVANTASARALGLGEQTVSEIEAIRVGQIKELVLQTANLNSVTNALLARANATGGGDPFASIEAAIKQAHQSGLAQLEASLTQELELDKQFSAWLDGIQAKGEAMKDAATVAQLQAGTTNALLTDALKTQQDLLSVNQQSLTAQQQSVDATQKVIDALKTFSDSLKVGALSTLSPAAQLAEARKQYNDSLSKAMQGDATAAGALPGFAQTFLQASRAYNASGSGYVTDFNSVQAGLTAVQDQFGAQLSTEQQILAQLQASNAKLGQQIAILNQQLGVQQQTAVQQQVAALVAAANASNGNASIVGPIVGMLHQLGYQLNVLSSLPNANGFVSPLPGTEYATPGFTTLAQSQANVAQQAIDDPIPNGTLDASGTHAWNAATNSWGPLPGATLGDVVDAVNRLVGITQDQMYAMQLAAERTGQPGF